MLGRGANRMRACFGLRPPYDFARAMPFLIACLGLMVILVLGGFQAFGAGLSPTANRAIFLYYVAMLLLASMVSARWRVASWLLLALAMTELLLALATHVGHAMGLPIPSLLPNREAFFGDGPRFKYHPLLMAVPKEGFVSTRGVDIRHNRHNLRGGEITLGAGQRLVNAYGGSTTYDVAVPQGATWPERLGGELGDDWVVANFGVPGYSSAEHVVQTAFYADRLGTMPVCSLYYMGWNDLRNAHLPDLDAGYADFHLLSQPGNLQIRGGGGASPLYRVLSAALSASFDTIPYPPDYHRLGPADGPDVRLEDIFRKNIQAIHALNAARGVRSVFIGQMLNPFRHDAGLGPEWLPRVRDQDVWPLQQRLNLIMKLEAERLGAASVVLEPEAFEASDFVDKGHFSVEGSRKFARLIAPEVRRLCRR